MAVPPFTTIPDLRLAPEAPVRSVDALALRDNPLAIAGAGAGTPPQIVTAAIEDDAVTIDKILDGDITKGEGWHGDLTRIKLLPGDFKFVGGPTATDYYYVVDTGDYGILISSGGSIGVQAQIIIPSGFKATHVYVYSSASKTVNVYENEIDDGTTATSKGSGNTNSLINITDVNSSTINYLTIKVTLDPNNQIYGGYVTIALI